MLEKIIKLVKLSQSDNDHEALSAIRHAHKLLYKEGLKWENVFGSEPKIIYRYTEKPSSGKSDSADDMFDYLFSHCDLVESVYAFVDSLYSFYEKRGYLTDKQEVALKKIYKNQVRWNGGD